MLLMKAIDESARTLLDGLDQVKWRSFRDCGAPDETYEWYYAENGVYIVRHHRLKSIQLIKAMSPKTAWDKLKRTFYGKDVTL